MNSDEHESSGDLYSQNPELVQQLSEKGANLIILNIPTGSEFGIDMQHWEIGERFLGVKMIPVGVHFVYFSNALNGTVAPRTGFFYNFREQETVAFEWNCKEELLEKIVDQEKCERLAANRQNLDRNMGPYPYEVYRHWLSLSDKLTPDLVKRVQPEGEFIYSVQQFIPQKYPPENKTTTKNGLPEMKEEPRSALRLTPIPLRRHPEGASATEISRCGMDGSYVLQVILQAITSEELLGELQFAFIVFLCGQQFEGFECWKKLVRVICSAGAAMENANLQNFFLNFITILHFQLKEVPRDFFLDIVSRENFLTDTLSMFFRNIADSAEEDGELKRKAKRFQTYLTRFFKWDFDQESEEDLPQVVQLE